MDSIIVFGPLGTLMCAWSIGDGATRVSPLALALVMDVVR
jgi:hypothetical protein